MESEPDFLAAAFFGLAESFDLAVSLDLATALGLAADFFLGFSVNF